MALNIPRTGTLLFRSLKHSSPPTRFGIRTPPSKDEVCFGLRPTWVVRMDPPFPGLDFKIVQAKIDALYEELFGYALEGFAKLHDNTSPRTYYTDLNQMDANTAEMVFKASLFSQNYGEAIPLSRVHAKRYLPYANKYSIQIDQIGRQLTESDDTIRLFNYAIFKFLTHPDRKVIACPADGDDLLRNFFVTVSPNEFMVDSSFFSDPNREENALNNVEAMFPFHDFSHWVAVSTSFEALKNEAPMFVHLYEQLFNNMSGIRHSPEKDPYSHGFLFEEITNSLYFKHCQDGVSNRELVTLIANDLVDYLSGNKAVDGYHCAQPHQPKTFFLPTELAILSMLSIGELPASQIDPNLSVRTRDPAIPRHRYLRDTFDTKTASERICMIATDYQNKLDDYEKRTFIKDWARHLAYIQLAKNFIDDQTLSDEDREFSIQILDWLLFNDLRRGEPRIPLLRLTMERMELFPKMSIEARNDFAVLSRREFAPIEIATDN